MAGLTARMQALTLRAAKPAAASKSAVTLAARRSASLSAGALQLQHKPAPARKAVPATQPLVVAKLKTRKSAAKRFKITASGKVVRRHAMKGHLLAKKSPGRKRHLGKEALVQRSDTNNVRDCLPYAGVA